MSVDAVSQLAAVFILEDVDSSIRMNACEPKLLLAIVNQVATQALQEALQRVPVVANALLLMHPGKEDSSIKMQIWV